MVGISCYCVRSQHSWRPRLEGRPHSKMFARFFRHPVTLRPRVNWYHTYNTLRFCVNKMAANEEEENMSGNVANTVMSARIKSSLNKLWNWSTVLISIFHWCIVKEILLSLVHYMDHERCTLRSSVIERASNLLHSHVVRVSFGNTCLFHLDI